MEIRLTEDYRVTDDPLQYILQERMIREKDGSEYWVNIGYYGSLEYLVRGLLNHEIHDADIHSLEEVITCLQACTEEICRNLTAME